MKMLLIVVGAIMVIGYTALFFVIKKQGKKRQTITMAIVAVLFILMLIIRIIDYKFQLGWL